MKQLFLYCYKHHKKETILGPLFKMIEAAFELGIPLLAAAIIEKGIKNKNWTYVWSLSVAVLALAIIGFVFSITAQYYAAKVATKTGTVLREKIFQKISKLPMSDINEEKTFLTLLTNDTYKIQDAIAYTLRLITRAPFAVIVPIIMAFIINYKYALIFLATTPLLFCIIYGIVKHTWNDIYSAQKKLDTLSHKTIESVSGSQVIQSFSLQESLITDFENESKNYFKKISRIEKLSTLANPLSALIINITIFFILLLAHFLSQNGINTPVGHLSAFINYLMQILIAVALLSNFTLLINKTSPSVARVQELMQKEEVEFSFKDGIDFTNDNTISIQNMSFQFENAQKETLSNINLTIQKNQTIGIIGSTGSGKSILIDLLARLYQPTKGSISLYGKNINEIENTLFAQILSICPQRAILYNDSVKNNLILSAPKEPTKDEIINALQITQSYDFIKQKEGGLDYKVKENGSNFSGGQRQRLTIARTILANGRILILDDSFSALDNLTSKRLYKEIKKMDYDNIIIVSQKVRDIMEMDKIIIFDNGTINQIGTHKSLMKNNKIYKDFCKSQSIFTKEVMSE